MHPEEDEDWCLGLLVVAVMILLLSVGGFFLYIGISEYKEFKQYTNFCEERPSFCYCSSEQCEYKTQETCINGVCNKSKETQELCDLAIKLEDKEMIFKAGCHG